MNANGESLIRDTDLLFLRGIVESPVIDKLKENTVQNSAKPLITNIRFVLELSQPRPGLLYIKGTVSCGSTFLKVFEP